MLAEIWSKNQFVSRKNRYKLYYSPKLFDPLFTTQYSLHVTKIELLEKYVFEKDYKIGLPSKRIALLFGSCMKWNLIACIQIQMKYDF